MTILIYFVKILIGYLMADFIMGIFHWVKDTYFNPHTPIIGKTFIWNSRLHHLKPHFICHSEDKTLLFNSALWTLGWMGPVFYFWGITPFTSSLYLTISVNDIVHKYSHMATRERPKWATLLQKLYISQSNKEHHRHHTAPFDSHYCPITPYVNIILERINFWKNLENIIEKYFGVKARALEDEFIEDDSYPASIRFIEN